MKQFHFSKIGICTTRDGHTASFEHYIAKQKQQSMFVTSVSKKRTRPAIKKDIFTNKKRNATPLPLSEMWKDTLQQENISQRDYLNLRNQGNVKKFIS